ncbi:MAG: RNA polymerase sigma factor SigZ [Blastocatellia bacterium]|nr:RNA polymerase sigma factor SigZ [Blastocatellia bacterium]
MSERTLDIWETFNQPLRAYIYKRVTNPEDADDILQEVFFRVHKRIDTLRDEERLPAWIYRITKNALIDHYRTRRHFAGIPETFDLEESPVEIDVEAKLAEKMPIMVMGCLPEKYGQALLLADLEGMTQRELAEQLGLSLSGAKSRVQRARRLLRDALMKCCQFEFDRRGRVIAYARRSCLPCTPGEEALYKLDHCSQARCD